MTAGGASKFSALTEVLLLLNTLALAHGKASLPINSGGTEIVTVDPFLVLSLFSRLRVKNWNWN